MRKILFAASIGIGMSACQDEITHAVRPLRTAIPGITVPRPTTTNMNPQPTSTPTLKTEDFSVESTEVEPKLFQWNFMESERRFIPEPTGDGNELFLVVNGELQELVSLKTRQPVFEKSSQHPPTPAASAINVSSDSFILTGEFAQKWGTASIDFAGLTCENVKSESIQMGEKSMAYLARSPACTLLYVRTPTDTHWLRSKLTFIEGGKRQILWAKRWRSYFMWIEQNGFYLISEDDLLRVAI